MLTDYICFINNITSGSGNHAAVSILVLGNISGVKSPRQGSKVIGEAEAEEIFISHCCGIGVAIADFILKSCLEYSLEIAPDAALSLHRDGCAVCVQID